MSSSWAKGLMRLGRETKAVYGENYGNAHTVGAKRKLFIDRKHTKTSKHTTARI